MIPPPTKTLITPPPVATRKSPTPVAQRPPPARRPKLARRSPRSGLPGGSEPPGTAPKAPAQLQQLQRQTGNQAAQQFLAASAAPQTPQREQPAPLPLPAPPIPATPSSPSAEAPVAPPEVAAAAPTVSPDAAIATSPAPEAAPVPDQPRMALASSPADQTATADEAGTAPAIAAPPAGAAAGGGGAAAVALDSSSGGALLQSLATASATAYPQALGQAGAAAAALHQQQKSDLQASFPVIEKPTGLPRLGGPRGGAPTILPAGQEPTLDTAGGVAGQEYGTTHPAAVGAVPGSDVSTAAAEPQEKSGSWWDWLVGRVSTFLGQLPTSDPGVDTSAGERPPVDLSGAADPAQTSQFQQQSSQSVLMQRAQADGAAQADFGENAIYPTVPAEMLQTTYQPGAAPGSGGGGIVVPAMPDAARAALDQSMGGWVQQQVTPQMQTYQQSQMTYEQQSQQARLEGEQRLQAETEQVRGQQIATQQQARQAVTSGRQQWQQQNEQIQAEFDTQSTVRQGEVNEQIAEETRSTDQKVEKKLTEAETQAATEQQKTETEAAAKKREYENKPRSFWESVKGGVSALFNTLRQAVNTLFTKLREFVKKTIEAAKKVVRGLIDLARDTIIGYIKGFGLLLKGLVTVALAAFPETAARAREWIDGQVDGAVEVVNQAAEVLKEAADAILDAVGMGLDAALAAVQMTLNLSLYLLEAAVMLQLQLMELMARLYEMLRPYWPLPEGLRRMAAYYEQRMTRALAKLAELLGLGPGEVTQTSLGIGGPAAGASPAGITPEALAGQIQSRLPVSMVSSPPGGAAAGGTPAAMGGGLPLAGGGVTLAAAGGGGSLGPRLPAGGCGLCYGTPKNAGIAAHNLIQAQFRTSNPFGKTEVPIRAPGDDTPPTGGRLDLAVRTGPNRIEIGEIKPGNTGAVFAGFGQLLFYEEILKKMLPNVQVGRLSRLVASPMPFPTLSPQPGCTVQSLIVLPPVDGLYAYICKPSFTELMARGCGCLPKEDKEKEKEKEKERERKKKEEEEKKKKEEKEKEKGREKEIDWVRVRQLVADIALYIAIGMLIALLIVALIVLFIPVPEPIHKVIAALASIGAAAALLFLIARVPPEEETPVA